MKVLGMMLLMMGVGGAAFGVPPAPEIDANTAGSAVALLSGAVLVWRSRR